MAETKHSGKQAAIRDLDTAKEGIYVSYCISKGFVVMAKLSRLHVDRIHCKVKRMTNYTAKLRE